MESSSCIVQNPSIISDPIDIEVVQSDVLTGKLFRERNEAWICSEDCVSIINVNNGLITQEWKCNYGKIYYSTEVVCYSSQFILVAAKVSTEAAASTVIVLNASSLSVVKLIFLPDEVTCISLVMFENDCYGVSSLLRYFDGIIAIGSYGGRLFLIDMALSQSHNHGIVHRPSPIKVINDGSIPKVASKDEHSTLLLFQGKNIV